jgi:hypothetical protein
MISESAIDSALEELEALAPLLSAEVRDASSDASGPSLRRRACKEALLTIGVSLEKLRAVRAIYLSQSMGRGRCLTCDGD